MRSPRRKLKAYRFRFEHWQEQAREPGLSALLVIEVALLFVITPLVGMGWLPPMTSRVTMILFIMATLLVTARSYVASGLVLFAVVLGVVGIVIHLEDPTLVTEWISAVGRLIAIGALSTVIARAVFGSGRVSVYRVQGAVVLYLNFAIFFFILYRL